jgi:CRP-like cAMP-binding protein
VWSEGDIVGIAGLWNADGYPATARALDDPTTLGWIPRETALRLHQEFPEFGFEFSRHLAERLRFVQESHSDRQGRPIAQQLALVLMTLSARMGPVISLTHEDLAHIIGTRRETVSRALQEFTRQGTVAVHYGVITVINSKALQERAEFHERD